MLSGFSYANMEPAMPCRVIQFGNCQDPLPRSVFGSRLRAQDDSKSTMKAKVNTQHVAYRGWSIRHILRFTTEKAKAIRKMLGFEDG